MCGIDEAGRGPLVGPVIAAAAYIPEELSLDIRSQINDSKTISESKREKIATLLKENIAYGIGKASAVEIDQINILQASLLAMSRAYETLIQNFPHHDIQLALIDGNKTPTLPIHAIPIVKGDQKSTSIAAASILAKTTRDFELKALAKQYPEYDWANNKGYPTASHLKALKEFGPTPHHRKTFKPVRQFFELDLAS